MYYFTIFYAKLFSKWKFLEATSKEQLIFACGKYNQYIIIDDTYGFDGPRYYTNYCPTLRSSRTGLKVAFGGTLTFKNSVQAPAVCEIADLKDILIETDCPYLTPHPFRGKTNEPKYANLVAEKIALIKNISYDKVVETTTQNALELFKKVK